MSSTPPGAPAAPPIRDLINQLSQLSQAFEASCYPEELRKVKLIGSEAKALELLWRAQGPLSVNALTSQLHLERTSVTRLCQRLEASGYLERGADERDGRAKALRLTLDGELLAERLAVAQAAAWAQLWAGLDPLSQHTLGLALPSLLEAMRKMTPKK